METLNKFSGILAVVAVVIAIIVPLFGGQDGSFGAVGTRFPNGLGVGSASMTVATNRFHASSTADFTGPVIIGANGGDINELRAATCNLLNADTSITASTTGYVYCTGITGLASGDVTFAQLSTSTSNAAVGGSWVLVSAKASSTAGAIDMMLWNGTGGNAVPSATNIGSSTNVLFIDN